MKVIVSGVMQIKALFLISFLSISVLSSAQTGDEYSMFMNVAGNKSILYRGHQTVQYSNFRYNGHYFWDSPTFIKGTVMLDGKRYDDVYLNVDACAGQLLSCAVPGAPVIAFNRDDVEWFEIDGKHFENLSLRNEYENVESGFYIVMKDGPAPVFFRVDKVIRSGTDDFNGVDGIGYDDPNYRKEVLTSFICMRRYYIVKNGKLKKVSSKQAIKLING